MKRLDWSDFLKKKSILPVLSSINPILFKEKDLASIKSDRVETLKRRSQT